MVPRSKGEELSIVLDAVICAVAGHNNIPEAPPILRVGVWEGWLYPHLGTDEVGRCLIDAMMDGKYDNPQNREHSDGAGTPFTVARRSKAGPPGLKSKMRGTIIFLAAVAGAAYAWRERQFSVSMIIAAVLLPLLAAFAIWLGRLGKPLAFSATLSTLAFGMAFAATLDQDHYGVLTFVTAIGFVWSLVEVVRLWLHGEDKAEDSL
jgi:hypothetical protein